MCLKICFIKKKLRYCDDCIIRVAYTLKYVYVFLAFFSISVHRKRPYKIKAFCFDIIKTFWVRTPSFTVDRCIYNVYVFYFFIAYIFKIYIYTITAFIVTIHKRWFCYQIYIQKKLRIWLKLHVTSMFSTRILKTLYFKNNFNFDIGLIRVGRHFLKIMNFPLNWKSCIFLIEHKLHWKQTIVSILLLLNKRRS